MTGERRGRRLLSAARLLTRPDDREGRRDRRNDRRRGARQGARDVRRRAAARGPDDVHGELPRPGPALPADHPLRGREAALDRRLRAAGEGSAVPLLSRARSACSTARASSTRDETPSLRNMLRRCVSTVFWLRNSVGRDLGVRLAVDDEPGELELALGERADADPVGLARPRAAVDALAELAQLALRLVRGSARRRARRTRPPRAQLGGGAVAVAGLGQRAAGQRAARPRLRPARRRRPPDGRRRQRLLAAVAGSSPASATAAAARAGPMRRPCRRPTAPRGRRVGEGAAALARGAPTVASRGSSARVDRPASRPERRQLLRSNRAGEGSRRPARGGRSPACDARTAAARAAITTWPASVASSRLSSAGGDRGLQFARPGRDERPVMNSVPGQSRRSWPDRRAASMAASSSSAASRSRPDTDSTVGERLREHRQELFLPGGARDAQTPHAVARSISAKRSRYTSAPARKAIASRRTASSSSGIVSIRSAAFRAVALGLVRWPRRTHMPERPRPGQHAVDARSATFRDLERPHAPPARVAVRLPVVGVQREDWRPPGSSRRRRRTRRRSRPRAEPATRSSRYCRTARRRRRPSRPRSHSGCRPPGSTRAPAAVGRKVDLLQQWPASEQRSDAGIEADREETPCGEPDEQPDREDPVPTVADSGGPNRKM